MPIIENNPSEKKWMAIITFLSLFVFSVVCLLFYRAETMNKVDESKSWVYILPMLNAFINSSVTIFLLFGFYFIRKKNIVLHRGFMLTAFIFSSLFLLSYILYHFNAPETKFGDLNHDSILSDSERIEAGSTRLVYFVILITHIILAATIVPLSLITFFRALSNRFDKHRKIAKITLPIWLYVSITGVVVYILISPYYPF